MMHNIIKNSFGKHLYCGGLLNQFINKERSIQGEADSSDRHSDRPSVDLYYFDWMQQLDVITSKCSNLNIKPIDENVKYTLCDTNLLFSLNKETKQCVIYYDEKNNIIFTEKPNQVSDYKFTFGFKENKTPYEFMIVVNGVCYKLVPNLS